MIVASVPRREDARDFVLTRQAGGLDALPDGATAGTSSMRRAALLRATQPKLRIAGLRGNVDTRLRKGVRGEGRRKGDGKQQGGKYSGDFHTIGLLA
jgi:hydroxymethylbilane synthase